MCRFLSHLISFDLSHAHSYFVSFDRQKLIEKDRAIESLLAKLNAQSKIQQESGSNALTQSDITSSKDPSSHTLFPPMHRTLNAPHLKDDRLMGLRKRERCNSEKPPSSAFRMPVTLSRALRIELDQAKGEEEREEKDDFERDTEGVEGEGGKGKEEEEV